MSKDSSKEVAVKEEANTAVAEYSSSDRGMGNLDSSDVDVPRLKLIHPLSPEVEDEDIEVKPGEFFHNVMEESVGKEVEFVPIMMAKSYILWNPRWEGGGILARADDGVHWKPADGKFTVRPSKDSRDTTIWETKPTVAESGLAEWGSSNPKEPSSGPAANKMINILVHLPDYPELSPCVISCQRSQLTPAKKISAWCKASTVGGGFIYQNKYLMKSVEDNDAKSGEDYLNVKFVRKGKTSDEDIEKCKAIYEEFARGFSVRAEDFDENSGHLEVEEVQDGGRDY